MGTQCLTLAQMMGSFLAWLVAPGILREEQPAQCSSHSVPECQMSSLQTISSWRPKASANSGDGSSHLCHVRERKALGSIAFGPDVGSVYCRKKTKGDLLAYSLHFSCACCRFWLIKQPPCCCCLPRFLLLKPHYWYAVPVHQARSSLRRLVWRLLHQPWVCAQMSFSPGGYLHQSEFFERNRTTRIFIYSEIYCKELVYVIVGAGEASPKFVGQLGQLETHGRIWCRSP